MNKNTRIVLSVLAGIFAGIIEYFLFIAIFINYYSDMNAAEAFWLDNIVGFLFAQIQFGAILLGIITGILIFFLVYLQLSKYESK
ncbi:MAG: hypothetical protein GF383_05370 [Candidatus Lokiarchaeota archaeon]|nr:hypothetical protein [Candidatus Lokiarchaeota archaeon]MBD3339326.1 hypothetical protein [Candidatus Lokiarchaeota archaeon]